MKNEKLDSIDRQLLHRLEHEARLSFAELAEQAGLSKTACWQRVRALETAGYIRGYRAVIDRQTLGLELQAFVHVSVSFDKHEAFETAVRGHHAIVSCHATTGNADYMLVVMVPDMSALDDLLRKQLGRMAGVRSFVTSIAMQDIKVGTPLTTVMPAAKSGSSRLPSGSVR
jgi:Lrp/AsnC family leucine-responsive transcriptional regulator